MDKMVLKEHNIVVYYDTHNILDEIENGDVNFSLDEELKEDILSGKRELSLYNRSNRKL